MRGLTSDTTLAAYLVKPDQRSYHLDDLVLRNLQRELTASDDSGQGMLDFEGGADESAARQEMVRATAVRDLAEALDLQVDATDGAGLLAELELPLIDVLAKMERTGIAVDVDGLDRLEQDFAAKVAQAQGEAWDAIGGEQINLGSPKQLQVVLFDTLGMPKTKKTKTGWTTDADALADLYAKTEHPFLEALLRHRDSARLRVTVEGLQKSVADDGRIHTTYLQTIAATGRLSSTEPNLQNVPIRTEEGRRIRELFVVGDGYESLMSADYSQIEMRVMAHLSGDAGLIEAFRTGEDLHKFVGSRVFGVEPEEVTSAMRSKVKAMSYGLAYGLSAFGLSKQLTIGTDEARGPDGRLLRALRRGARLPARRRRRGARHRLDRDDVRSAPLPARPHLRQPPAPRDGRADGAQRPDPGLGRRHHEGRDDRGRPGAHRRRRPLAACCSRCTTSSSSRSRRGSGSPSRRSSATRWARPPTSTSRSTSTSASATPGTTPPTDPPRRVPHFPPPSSAHFHRPIPTPSSVGELGHPTVPWGGGNWPLDGGVGRGEVGTRRWNGQAGLSQTKIAVPGSSRPRRGDQPPHASVWPSGHSGSTRSRRTSPAAVISRTRSPRVRWCST